MASLFSLSLVLGTRVLFPRKGHISPFQACSLASIISWRAPRSSPDPRGVLPVQVRGSGLRAGAASPSHLRGGLTAVVGKM